jgi:hypothetical protein
MPWMRVATGGYGRGQRPCAAGHATGASRLGRRGGRGSGLPLLARGPAPRP